MAALADGVHPRRDRRLVPGGLLPRVRESPVSASASSASAASVSASASAASISAASVSASASAASISARRFRRHRGSSAPRPKPRRRHRRGPPAGPTTGSSNSSVSLTSISPSHRPDGSRLFCSTIVSRLPGPTSASTLPARAHSTVQAKVSLAGEPRGLLSTDTDMVIRSRPRVKVHSRLVPGTLAEQHAQASSTAMRRSSISSRVKSRRAAARGPRCAARTGRRPRPHADRYLVGRLAAASRLRGERRRGSCRERSLRRGPGAGGLPGRRLRSSLRSRLPPMKLAASVDAAAGSCLQLTVSAPLH